MDQMTKFFRSGKFRLIDYHYPANYNVLVSYKGPFDKNVLNMLGENIREIIVPNSITGKKISKIFIELAKNIGSYSAERIILEKGTSGGIGSLVLVDSDNHYSFITGNLTMSTEIEPIVERCKLINSMDKNGLRKMKREQLKQGKYEREGADIGLIQLALTSENPLDYEIIQVDSTHSFFSLTVQINK